MSQRRYNQEQVDRIVESGEKAPDMGYARRVATNMVAGIPRAPTDIMTLLGMAPAFARTGAGNIGSSLGLSEDPDLTTEVYGKEGIEEYTKFIESSVQKEVAKLPENYRNQKNYDAIENHYRHSDTARDILIKHSPALTRWGMNAGNWINEQAGLGRIEDETFVDELSQIAGSSVIPFGPLVKAPTTVLRRGAMTALELALPGNTGTIGNAVANVAVGTALSQGFRGVTDQPSVFTGDALGPEYGIDHTYEADRDPEAGMNGEQLAAIGGTIGSIITGAAILSGKGNRVIAKKTINDIDGPKMPDPDEKLSPTLSTGQRIHSETVDQSSPLRSTLKNAIEPKKSSPLAPISKELEDAFADIERVTMNASNANLNTMHRLAIDDGQIPGLGRQTVPLRKIERAIGESAPEEQKLLNDYMIAKTQLDRHQLELNSLDEKLAMQRMNLTTQEGMREFSGTQARRVAVAGDEHQFATGMSVREARELVAQGQANPKILAIENDLRKISNDIIDAKLNDGQITQRSADIMRKSHPNHMFLQQDTEAGAGAAKRWMKGLFGEIKGTDQHSLYGKNRGPVLDTKSELDVTQPLPVVSAWKQYLYDHIQYSAQNDATRAYVNAMKATPDWGRAVREVDSMTVDEFSVRGESKKVKGRDDIFAYTQNGRIHYMEAADPETLRALRWNAPATAFAFNFMRKMFQQGTTGFFSPEYAPTSALFEHGVAKVTRKDGRAYGMIDSTLRRAMPNSTALDAVMNRVGDPTAGVQMIAGIFQQVTLSNMKKAAQKIADDLEQQSGLFNLIAKTPGGKEVLQNASEAMLRAYNDSRFAVYTNAGIKQANLMDDPLKSVRNGYAGVEYAVRGMKPLSVAFDQYKNMLEAVHNSSKYAFFAQNYARLQRQYKNNVPQSEVDKLAAETKALSGDMTRAVGNSTLSKTVSAFPYTQIAINASGHYAAAIQRNPTTVGMRILTGAVLPKVAAVALISQSESLSDWYWNELPTWQRLTKIPVIGPDYWMDIAKGNQRPLGPADIYMMAEAPENTMITNQVITFMRAMGWFGGDVQARGSYAKEFAEGLSGVTSLATPPLIGALASGQKIELSNVLTGLMTGDPIIEEAYMSSPHQGANGEGINADSMFSRSFMAATVSLFGIAVGNMVSSADVALQSLDNGDQFNEALGKAFQYDVYQRERRVTEIPGTREAGAYLYTNGQRRQYASTARRERVVDTLQSFKPVMELLTAENDRSGTNAAAKAQGFEPINSITNPQIKQLAIEMNDSLNKNPMRGLNMQRVEQNKMLAILEKNKDHISPRDYHEKHIDIMNKMDEIGLKQEQSLDQLSAFLQSKYQLDIPTAIDTIIGSIGQK